MSQVVGQSFKSRIPTFGDDASIEEALRVYHYGVDNYTTQVIPDDSIEGNFRSLDSRVTTVESTITGAVQDYVKRISDSSNPNIITGETTTTIPLVIRAISSQTSSLQQWQNSSSTIVGRISTGGSLGLAGYASVGTTTVSSSTSVLINLANPSHKGIVVKSSSGQSGNLQEWQNSSGTAISWISSNGSIFSKGEEVQTVNPFLLMGS